MLEIVIVFSVVMVFVGFGAMIIGGSRAPSNTERILSAQRDMDEKILFRGLLYGLFGGAFATASTIALITLI